MGDDDVTNNGLLGTVANNSYALRGMNATSTLKSDTGLVFAEFVAGRRIAAIEDNVGYLKGQLTAIKENNKNVAESGAKLFTALRTHGMPEAMAEQRAARFMRAVAALLNEEVLIMWPESTVQFAAQEASRRVATNLAPVAAIAQQASVATPKRTRKAK